MKETFNLALIYGSAREDRFCDTVADWAIKILKTDPDLSVDIIDSRAGTTSTEALTTRGEFIWPALLRKLDRIDKSYRD